MERDTQNHPAPHSRAVNVSGDDLTDEQLDALTPEQRERLTSGDPLPVDPRSPLLDDADEVAGATVVDPAFDPDRELTMGGAPVDPHAGGDATGDGTTGTGDRRDNRDEPDGDELDGDVDEQTEREAAAQREEMGLPPVNSGPGTPIADGLHEPLAPADQ